jgi:hypothetical protein
MWDLSLAVFSTKQVINWGKVIIYVVHDSDGEWQFLSGDNVTTDDLMIVALGSLLERDPTLNDVLSINPGYEATRDGVAGNWKITVIQE